MWPAIISAGALLGSTVANWFSQKNTRDYQEEMQEESWEREDNAVQRRAKDLAAAGINPLLAAGQAAQSSSPIQVTTPQLDTDSLAAIPSRIMELQQMKKNIEQTDVDIARNKEITRDLKMKNDLEEATRNFMQNDMILKGNTPDSGANAMAMRNVQLLHNDEEMSFANLANAKSVAEQAAYDAARSGILSKSAARDFDILKSRGLRSNADPSLMNSMDYRDYLKNGHQFKKTLDLLGSGILKNIGGGATSYPNTAGMAIKAAELAK